MLFSPTARHHPPTRRGAACGVQETWFVQRRRRDLARRVVRRLAEGAGRGPCVAADVIFGGERVLPAWPRHAGGPRRAAGLPSRRRFAAGKHTGFAHRNVVVPGCARRRRRDVPRGGRALQRQRRRRRSGARPFCATARRPTARTLTCCSSGLVAGLGRTLSALLTHPSLAVNKAASPHIKRLVEEAPPETGVRM